MLRERTAGLPPSLGNVQNSGIFGERGGGGDQSLQRGIRHRQLRQILHYAICRKICVNVVKVAEKLGNGGNDGAAAYL